MSLPPPSELGTRLDRALHAPPKPRAPWRPPWPYVVVVFAAVPATMFGMVTGFFPSARWALIAPYVSLPIGLAAGVPFALQATRDTAKYRHAAAALILLATVGCSWAVFSLALPDVYTSIHGQPFREEQRVTALLPGGRKCPTEIHAPMFELRVPRPYLCVEIGSAIGIRASGMAVFSGRESWFGRHVERVEAAPGSAPGS